MAITTETRALSGAAGLAFFAGAAQAQTLDETINGLFASATGWFVNFIFAPFPGTSFPWIVAWLVVAASIFTALLQNSDRRGFTLGIHAVRRAA